MILEKIEDELYTKACQWFDDHGTQAKLKVTFSPEGHARCRAEKLSSCFFNDTHIKPATTFAGYPFVIDRHQVESYKITIND